LAGELNLSQIPSWTKGRDMKGGEKMGKEGVEGMSGKRGEESSS